MWASATTGTKRISAPVENAPMSEADPPAEPEAEEATPAAKDRRTRGRRCGGCGARLRGRFCNACGLRDPDYDQILCGNCGAEKQGLYCAVCGQNDRDYQRSVFPVVGEMLAETFETDSRLFRTARVLFTRPGFLSSEFSSNRRAGYISPFRLYLFTSIIFFFALSLRIDLPEGPLGASDAAGNVTADEGPPREGDGPATVGEPDPALAADAGRAGTERGPRLLRVNVNLTGDASPEGGEGEAKPPVAGESDGFARGPDGRLLLTPEQQERVEWFRGVLDERRSQKLTEILHRPLVGDAFAAALLGRHEEDYESVGNASRYVIGQLVDVLHRPSDAARAWFENLPVAMFCLLPFYAFLLKVFYLGRKRFYSEHLVFGMHIHTVAYLVFTVMILIPDIEPSGWAKLALLLGLAGYYFVALKRYYEQGVFMTLVKYVLLGTVYSVLLVLALVGAAGAVLMLY